MSENRILFLLAESPIHAGDKPQKQGDIDLPIQKESATGYPVVRGSTVRGSLRHVARSKALAVEELFGSEPESEERKPGIIDVSDFHLLLYPVRTLSGLFAWITTPFLFQHLKRSLDICGSAEKITVPSSDDKIRVASGSKLLVKGKLSLEEAVFPASESPELAALGLWIARKALPEQDSYNYLKGMAITNLALVPDEVFQKLLPLVIAVFPRIRIDPVTGIVAEGALWNTEYLPSETLLCGTFRVKDESKTPESVKKLIEVMRSSWFQIGGNAGIGMGIVSSVWM
jgi:CRISPR-associated protein Cmr4